MKFRLPAGVIFGVQSVPNQCLKGFRGFWKRTASVPVRFHRSLIRTGRQPTLWFERALPNGEWRMENEERQAITTENGGMETKAGLLDLIEF